MTFLPESGLTHQRSFLMIIYCVKIESVLKTTDLNKDHFLVRFSDSIDSVCKGILFLVRIHWILSFIINWHTALKTSGHTIDQTISFSCLISLITSFATGLLTSTSSGPFSPLAPCSPAPCIFTRLRETDLIQKVDIIDIWSLVSRIGILDFFKIVQKSLKILKNFLNMNS